jgi:hypothetical protein
MGTGKAFAGTINLALTGAVPETRARSEWIGKVPALVAAQPAECGDMRVSKRMELPRFAGCAGCGFRVSHDLRGN